MGALAGLRGALAVALLLIGGGVAEAAIGAAEREQLRAVAELVREAGKLYTEGEYAACGEKVRAAQQGLAELTQTADPELLRAAEPLYSRLGRAHALLELEGVLLPPLVPPGEADEPAEPDDGDGTPESKSEEPDPEMEQPEPEMDEAGGVSFAGQVAPILAARCGGCHIDQRKGNFSLASFAALAQGPPEGVVIFPEDPDGSRLVETIVTGDMPRGGGRVADAELELIKQWIREGAKFDGPSQRAPLRSYARANAANADAAAGMREVRQATGEETVSFARDVAPLLLQNCNGCHIDAMQTRGGLRMDAFAQLMRGGDSGALLEPGDGPGSLLVRRLRGEDGARMPAGGRPALSDEQIELIATWIDEGATLDGPNPDQPLRVLTARAWASAATHEELAERRREMAEANWRLGSPGAAPKTREDDSVLVLGAVGDATLELVAEEAAKAFEAARTVVRAASTADKGEPPIRGRVTIFVFPRRYDYSEFGKMIERRSLPGDWRGHWRFDGVDAYAAVVVGAEDSPEEVRARLTGFLASIIVAQTGDVPRWISEGLGRVAAARAGGSKVEFPRAWDEELRVAVSGLKEPDDLVEQRLPPEQADALSYGIGRFLSDRVVRRRTDQLLRKLADGEPFAEALQTSFGMEPKELMVAYLGWQAQQRRR